jgi:DNA-binding MarR family transcriptional regulator
LFHQSLGITVFVRSKGHVTQLVALRTNYGYDEAMFEQCLYFNTTSLARKLEREWAQAFKEFGLTPSQAFLLRVVLEKNGALQSELAQEMNISRSTATRTLDQLQKMHYVERQQSASDGRETVIAPTARAKKIWTELNEASGAVTKRMKRKLGDRAFKDVVATVKAASETI